MCDAVGAGRDVVVPWLLKKGPDKRIVQSGQREQIARALRPVPRSTHGLLKLLTDTHNHAAGTGEKSRKAFNVDLKEGRLDMHAKEYVVVSVESADWKSCTQWERPCAQRPVRAGIGVHPQCADEVSPGDTSEEPPAWVEAMRACLRRNPWSLVGEIGLDRNRSFKHHFKSHQLSAWQHQLRLATELKRPISVHTVKAFGALVDCLEAEAKSGRSFPPTICLHSFSGSIDTLKRIIRIVEGRGTKSPVRVFVGFNAWTNLFKKTARSFLRDLVDKIHHGESRILLESDWHPADFVFPGSNRRDVDKILLNGVLDMARMLEWDALRVAKTVERNTSLFLESIDARSAPCTTSDLDGTSSTSCAEKDDDSRRAS
eukprot:g411.t1